MSIRDRADYTKNCHLINSYLILTDGVGTLNYTSAADIVAAAQLVRKGKVISLALNFDDKGPQGAKTSYPALGRFNPIHLMLRTGTDAYSGVLDRRRIRSADDLVLMPLQASTQWDGLAHIFYGGQMYNGYDCRLVSTTGAAKCGIEKIKEKMVGRGVLLDVARAQGVNWLPDGFAITSDDLDRTAKLQNVQVRRGDYLIVRTGHMETALRLKVPVPTIVMNNASLAFEYHVQKFIHKEMCPEASEFLDINYAEVAKAFGAYGERVTSPDALKPALRRAEESGRPALIDVAISREVVPPVSRYEAVTKREL